MRKMKSVSLTFVVTLFFWSGLTFAEGTEGKEKFWEKFPSDPPFELTEEETVRFRKLWKRSLCLHSRRGKAVGQKDLSRTFHHKIHGCLRGKLVMNPARPKQGKEGVFKNDESKDIWLRYTNINHTADNRPDLRGLAFVVEGVGVNEDRTQDFLANDTKRHFVSTPEEIVEFTEHAAQGPTGLQKYALKDTEDLKEVFGSVEKAIDQFKENPNNFFAEIKKHPKLKFTYLNRALDIQKNQSDKPLSLLKKEFHSRAPFMLGQKKIKYAIVPSKTYKKVFEPSENHLSHDLAFYARASKIKLKFVVRFFENEKITPLHDYTKVWKSKEYTLATLEFEKQDITTRKRVEKCKGFTFDPWHFLPAHRPIGIVNKGRYYIYHASRLQSNPDTRVKLKCD